MASIRKRKFGPDNEHEAWVVDYVDQQGKRRLKTFSTKKDAEAWRTTALHEIQQGVHTAASVSKTVEEVWRLWLADCEANGLEFGTVKAAPATSQSPRRSFHRAQATGGADNPARL
jgi:hypothetical protein